jgi:hypothetical protein
VAWSTRTLAEYCHAAFDNHYPISAAGIWADAARQKQPVVINDYASAENKGGLPDGHSPLKRLISVPVMEDGEVRMMTGVGNKATHYDANDVETVQLLGNEAWRIVRRQRAEKALRIANQVVNASPVVCFRWAPSRVGRWFLFQKMCGIGVICRRICWRVTHLLPSWCIPMIWPGWLKR